MQAIQEHTFFNKYYLMYKYIYLTSFIHSLKLGQEIISE